MPKAKTPDAPRKQPEATHTTCTTCGNLVPLAKPTCEVDGTEVAK